MEGTKLIEVLEALTLKERKEITVYLEEISIPLKSKVQALWRYITAPNDLDINYLKKENVFKAIFSKEAYDPLKLRRVRSYLLKSIESYLWNKAASVTPFAKNLYLNHWYRKRKTSKSFDYTQSVLEQHFETSPYRDSVYYFESYLKENEEYLYMESEKRTTQKNLQPLSDTLETAFVLEKLKQSCTLLAHQAVYETNYKTGLLGAILEAIETGVYAHIPAINVYYLIYKALETPTEESHFLEFKFVLSQYLPLFRKAEQRTLFLLAINYCIKKINTGNQQFKQVLFELYQEGLTQSILLENGQLSRWTYKNVIALGLGLKEFDWVEQFIKKYKNELPATYREDSYNFNLAKLYYTQKAYQKAMTLLLDVKFEDVLLQLNARMLLLKIYFELGETQVLAAYLNSFEVFLRRQKSVTYHKTSYLNLVSISKRILALNPYDKTAQSKLKERIEKTKILPERDWLLGLLD